MKLALPPQQSVPSFITWPAREPMLPCTTTSAPRIATPAIAPALPRTTTEPLEHVVGEAPADVAVDLEPRARRSGPAQK